MSYLRSAHERAAYRRVVYENTDVYVNKLDIRDQALLEQTQRALTAKRAAQGFPATANHRTYSGFKAIHRHLFQDLYTWAGRERRYATGRGPVPFAVPEHIGSWIERQFAGLARDRYLVGRSRNDFAEAAARYVNEINAAHPFIDGNGRAQRFWLRMLANNAGFELTLTDADTKRWNDASRIGFTGANNAPMAALLKRRLKSLDEDGSPSGSPSPRRRKRQGPDPAAR